MSTKTTDANETTSNKSARFDEIRSTVGNVGGALTEGTKAYFTGLGELATTLGGFGREVLQDTGSHVRATVQAKSLRDVADLQVAFVQNRIEMSATHSKEFVDLARIKAESTLAPITGLLQQKTS